MKFPNIFKLLCLFTLSSQLVYANSYAFNMPKSCDSRAPFCDPKCIYATSSLTTSDENDQYTILTVDYLHPVPLSKRRNHGFTRGNIELTSKGIKILSSGDYWVSFSAILSNPVQSYVPLIPVFVVQNGQFDPNATNTVGNVVSLLPGLQTTVEGSGVLRNLKKGTKLSIIASNGGSPEPQPVIVIGWNITLFKLPCCEKRKHTR